MENVRVPSHDCAESTKNVGTHSVSRWRTAATLLALYLSLFIAALDSTIVATSVPVITADLRSPSGYYWIGGAYLLAQATIMPIWGRVSDIWGRKCPLIGAIALYSGGSILAARSATMSVLIAARALQGAATGGLEQLVNIIISDLFSMRDRTIYFGIAEVIWAVAGGVGPVLGGTLAERASWRWEFYINLPACAVALCLTIVYLDVHNPRTPVRGGLLAIDWTGTAAGLSTTLIWLLCLDFGGTELSWSSPAMVCLLVLGVVTLVFFVFNEARLARYPLIPSKILEGWSAKATFLVTFCNGLCFAGSEYYLPLYFQGVLGVPPMRSGVLILPLMLCTTVTGFVSGLLMHGTGKYKVILCAGQAISTIGLGLYVLLKPHTSIAQVIGYQLVQGFGAGLLFQPLLIAILATVEPTDSASATSTTGFVRSFGAALGVTLGGILFRRGMASQATISRANGLATTIGDQFFHGNAMAHVERIQKLGSGHGAPTVRAAFGHSLRNLWIAYACIGGLGVIASMHIRQYALSEQHTVSKTGIGEMKERAHV